MAFMPDVTTLATMAARSATAGTVGYKGIPPQPGRRGAMFCLDWDARSSTATGVTCDVFVEGSIDKENWLTIVHFPQMGSTSTDRFPSWQRYENIYPGIGAAAISSTSAVPAAGNANDFELPYYRVRWTRAPGATATFSFTFAVHAY